MTEGPLLIQPYIDKMTASELHAILTSNFSCIAGTLFAAYISLGACPNYLLSSSIMSAPGSLACSKLLFPETEESHLKDIKDLELPRGSETTALECLSNGASATVQIVFSIGANLLVVIAFLAFFDDVIGYLGELVGIYGLSFQMLLGYLFFPLAYLMGVTDDLNETLHVAQLMGTKTALNEFIAYQKLGELTASNLLTPKAAMIATYALCGFSNFSAVGMQLEFLGKLAPSRKTILSKIVMRALLAGSISCFFTASIAGILVHEPKECLPASANRHCFDPNKFVNSTPYFPAT
ncbi:hypothetical protein WR25_23015 isoform F [Diploscapter pachys]|nr:hypothetical protein WR25_23015 isoform F [Diploscapter pachys]